MFLRLNVSLAATNTAISWTSAARARSSPGRLGTSAGYRVVGRRVMPREDLGRIGHLRDPCRTDERRDLDDRAPGVAQAVDEGDLVCGGDGGALVLQPVARSDLHDGHLFSS